MIGEILSLVISIIYLITAYIYGKGEAVLACLTFLLIPLACIWFSDYMGKYIGWVFGGIPAKVTSESPGILMKIVGWVLLLFPVIIYIFISTIY